MSKEKILLEALDAIALEISTNKYPRISLLRDIAINAIAEYNDVPSDSKNEEMLEMCKLAFTQIRDGFEFPRSVAQGALIIMDGKIPVINEPNP